jgi:hypothetical protein
MSSVIPWSYSSLTAYETCPRRFKITKIDKLIREPQTEATIHGNEVHKALEDAVSGEKMLASKYTNYAPLVKKLRAARGRKLVETKFALTNTLRPTEFSAKDAWVRGVIDLAIIQPTSAVILDYKTGKVKVDHDQLKLFAATTFAMHPYLERVKTGYLWLAYNKTDTADFSKSDAPGIWQEFLPRVKRMETSVSTDEFLPRPSGLCKNWCPVGKTLCEFCGKD